MPMGLIVMRWDERIGVEILATYPEDAEIKEKTLMQIYSQHEFSGSAGMVSLTAGSTNLASYYTGPETSIYIVLVLSLDEDGEAYEEGLVEIARQVLMNTESEELEKILPSLFQRLSVYPTLNLEQRIAMIFNSETKRMIMKRLREETLLAKSEISIWMKDVYTEGFVDIDNLIQSLVRLDLVKIASVKGLTSDVVFLTGDILALRVPPEDLVKDPVGRHIPASLKDAYLTEVRNYFKEYEISEKDSLKIIDEVILEPQVYEVLKLLRNAIVTRNDIEKLKKKGVDDVNMALKHLWENKMISVLQDENGTEYYGLISDFYVDRIYPKYEVNQIRQHYEQRTKNPQALVKALELLKEEFYAQRKKKSGAEEAEMEA